MDGTPNRRNKAAFSHISGVGNESCLKVVNVITVILNMTDVLETCL